MQAAEQRARKNRKPGPGIDRLANAAKLGALEKNLGIHIKRHRDPGVSDINTNPFSKEGEEKVQSKDETVVVESGF